MRSANRRNRAIDGGGAALYACILPVLPRPLQAAVVLQQAAQGRLLVFCLLSVDALLVVFGSALMPRAGYLLSLFFCPSGDASSSMVERDGSNRRPVGQWRKLLLITQR
jgi:hypothetical protein